MKTTYANGDVYSASDVNDITGTINLLTSSTLSNSAGKNLVINGGMDIWQRGTSALAAATSTATGFTADRWQLYRGSFTANCTASRQATGDTTNLPSIQYGLRVQRTAADTSTQFIRTLQTFETVNSIPLAGKTVVISYYAKRGANYSSASNAFSILVDYGTGTDQNYIGGFTGNTNIANNAVTLTTTYQRFTTSFTVPATATQLAIYYGYTPSGTAGANDWFEITGIQLELGATATTFSRAGGSIQGELAACQRYYFRNTGTTGETIINIGFANSSTAGSGQIQFPVPMRVTPTSLDSATIRFQNYGGATYNMTSVSFNEASPIAAQVFGTISGAVAGHVGKVTGQSAGSYVGLSAEL
jgi:hypothetical protein